MYTYKLPAHVDGNLEFHLQSPIRKLVIYCLAFLLPLYVFLILTYLHFEDPTNRLLPIGVGILFLATPLWITTRALPHTIIFHNVDRRVYFLQTQDQTTARAASLPYSDIASFSVSETIAQHAAGDGSNGALSWHVTLENRDGSEWALATCSDQTDAASLAKHFEASIIRESGWQTGKTERVSDIFNVREDGTSAEVTWSVNRLTRHRASLWLGLAGSIPTVMGAFSVGGSADYLGYGALVIGAISIWALFSPPPTRLITISPTELSFKPMWFIFKNSPFEGTPISALHALNFNLHEATHLSVIQKADQTFFANVLRDDQVPDLRQLAGQVINIKRIDCVGLTPAEVLELKNVLRDQIERLSGARLL